MTPLRTLAAVLLAAAATASLSGCTDTVAETRADNARTSACRSYLLTIGSEDEQAVRLLTHADRSGTWDNDTVNRPLENIRAAAIASGTTPHLSQSDFETFKALASVTSDTYAAANPNGGLSINTVTVSTFETATTAVQEMCAA